MTKSRKLAYLALLSSSLLWGLAPPIIKYTLNFVTPASFLFFRFTLASVIFSLPLLYVVIKTRPSFYDISQYFLLGFLCTPLNLLFYFWGVARTSAIDASIVAILSPILVVLGGLFFLRENITKKETLGIVISVLGVVALTLGPLVGQKSAFLSNLTGNLLIIGGDIVWAAFTLLSKRQKNRRLDPFILSSFSFIVGWFVLLPLFAAERLGNPAVPFFEYLDPRALPGIIYMAVFSSVIAYSAFIYGLSKIEASEASIFIYLQPVFAIPVSVIFLGEKLTTPLAVGSILVTAGVFICESRSSLRR